MRKTLATLGLGCMLFFGAPDAAEAQQDGLVNVEIGDVTILEDVNVAVAAQIVAAICVQDVNVVLLAANLVDQGGNDFTCEARNGREITITQN